MTMPDDDTAWTDARRALWRRLAAHDFAPVDVPLDFTARLAREHGWSRADAAAAIDEYRRFCFLAMTAGHAVTPSDDVDEVWHLHLTQTRDYWQRFVPDVLGADLHHDATRGTRDDRARHREDYARTLASYERFFGAPPARWWPGTQARFADARRWRRVDLTRAWVVPKPRLASVARAAAAVVALVVGGRALAQDLGPLDLTGGPFLGLYAVLFVIAFAVCVYLRWHLRTPDQAGGLPPADPIALAYLAGGAERAADAAATELLAAGQAQWDAATRRLVLTVPVSDVRLPLVGYAKSLARDGEPTSLVKRASNVFHDVALDLRHRGLLLDEAMQWRARWLAVVPLVGLMLFGLAKVVVGLSRERPVEGLVFFLVVTGIAAFVMARRPLFRTRAGDRMLRQVRAKHSRAARAPLPTEMALAVALGGTMLLSGTAYAAYHQARVPPSSSSSSDSSSSSSDRSGDSGGDGGGSSGCGGCGGGGGD